MKIFPGDTNKPRIISDGGEWNVKEFKNKDDEPKRLRKEE